MSRPSNSRALARLLGEKGGRGGAATACFAEDGIGSQSTPARLSAGDSFFYANFTYDLASRVTQASRPVSDSDPTAQTTTTYYEGLTTRVVDALGKQSKQIANALGQVVRSSDHDNYYQNVDYEAFGNAVRVQDSAGATLQTGTYNIRGLRTASTNIDLGSWTYSYNALGEMTSYTDANSKTITQTFDALGRPLTRVMPEGGGSITSTWTWGTSAGAHEIGRLKSQQISGSGIATYSETFSFDSLGRPSQTQYAENGNTYTVNQTYSTLTGFVDTLTYPTSTSSYRLKLQYDYQNGALWKVKDYNAPSTVFWQANAANARGQVTEQVLGNGLKTVRSFDQVTGWIDYIQTGPGGGTSVQNLSYLWDKVGNLAQRQDNNQGLTENAYYDNLYRLDYTTLNGSTNLDLSYAANGNIQSQSGVGTYTYHGTKIHAVASINTGGGIWSFSYDSNGNMTNRNGTTLAWYASNLPKSITKDSQNSSTFQYTPSGQRWQHAYKVANVTYTHVYVGSLMEKVTQSSNVDWKHYIFAEGQAVALYSRKSSGTNTLSYLLRDHQGSVDVITSSAGAVVVRESFNAYGQRRGTAWSGSPSAGDITTINGLTRRGYTDHEMLDSTALVHMNGRVYDPLIARFVSADPYLDTALGTQAWNVFAYVGGNPLSFIDPSGFNGERKRFKVKPVNAQSQGESTSPPPLELVYVLGRREVSSGTRSIYGPFINGPGGTSGRGGDGGGGGGGGGGWNPGSNQTPDSSTEEEQPLEEVVVEGERPQSQPCTGMAGAVQDFTGGDNGLGWGEWLDSTKSNYSDTMDFDVVSIGDHGVGLDTPIATGTAPFVAKTWGGVTPGQAFSQVVAAARATIKTPGLIGFRTPLQLTATVGASWAWNAVVANVSYRVGVGAGSALRAGVNQLATYACSKQD
ncbi:MAG: RHS repeat-associated core domain-containing protein [Steroidobacteraceae bacterium]|nr:RHS repeat-associated core domain-containing protein [Steroidobacteraceae bacterium]